jgi:hypothetical protein
MEIVVEAQEIYGKMGTSKEYRKGIGYRVKCYTLQRNSSTHGMDIN